MDEEFILSWIRDKQVQDIEDYVRRGRQLADVPTEKLLSRWIELFKYRAAQPDIVEPSVESTDIEAELQIRKVDIPLDLVETEFNEISRKMRVAWDKVQKDPVRLKQASDSALDDFVEFLDASAKSGKH